MSSVENVEPPALPHCPDCGFVALYPHTCPPKASIEFREAFEKYKAEIYEA